MLELSGQKNCLGRKIQVENRDDKFFSAWRDKKNADVVVCYMSQCPS